jgi:hypothetical protein
MIDQKGMIGERVRSAVASQAAQGAVEYFWR